MVRDNIPVRYTGQASTVGYSTPCDFNTMATVATGVRWLGRLAVFGVLGVFLRQLLAPTTQEGPHAHAPARDAADLSRRGEARSEQEGKQPALIGLLAGGEQALGHGLLPDPFQVHPGAVVADTDLDLATDMMLSMKMTKMEKRDIFLAQRRSSEVL